MYLKNFAIDNIKCFASSQISFTPDVSGSYAGWNVILGVNGTGKSTLLQAMALTLVGPVVGSELLRPGEREAWVRAGAASGCLKAEILRGEFDTALGQPRKTPYPVELHIIGREKTTINGEELIHPQLYMEPKLRKSLEAGPYSRQHGWFSAGYGPFRRLSGGGSEEDQRLVWQGLGAGWLVTLFRESAALTRCEPWLMDLHNQANDPALPQKDKAFAGKTLEILRNLLDSILPFGMRLGTVTSQKVSFINADGLTVQLSQLSDGFRSFLAFAIDLLRQILSNEEHGAIPQADGRYLLDTEGVVFIDEADAHLHPSWQRDLGFWLCSMFPKIQFIVSTHSPLIAQAARPQGLFLLKAGKNQAIEIMQADPVRGWTVDQILLSPSFGLASTRDPETSSYMKRRQQLLSQATRSSDENSELDGLNTTLKDRLQAPGDSLEELESRRAMMEYVRKRLGEKL